VVPSDEGPHRKYYGLNDRGRNALDQSTKTWGSFTRALDHLLNGRSSANGN
jgi:PadR family transcriptional regulator PadR